MNKNSFLKWVMIVSFLVLLVGGINYLLMAIFNFNLFFEIFGTGAGARVFYGLFGVAALVLLATLLIRMFSKNSK
jgi:uncharacterized membrane protein YuzA (DUF378 family)